MTLNITILTPNIIYQSADYALFDEVAKKPIQMPSTKVVVLNDFDWTGFITYTGIGRIGRKHTSEFVNEWLQGLNRPSFGDVVETIRNRGTQWISQVCPGARHTFVLAAFVDGCSTAAVVSNFQKWHGLDSSVEDNFKVSTVVASSDTEVIITGMRNAVPRYRRRFLQRLAKKYSNDGSRVRRAMAEITAQGSQSYPGMISNDCFVYSQDIGGQGHYESMGVTRADNPMLMGGLTANVRSLLDNQYGSSRWSLKKAVTSTTSHNQSPPPAHCVLELATGIASTHYEIVELTSPEGRRATPRSINSSGVIVGEGCAHWRGPSYPCIWSQENQIDFLPHGGGFGGSARSINESGLIVGASEGADRALHACKWDIDGSALDIGGSIATHSEAKVINECGSTAGWASIHSTESGQAHHRPAYWPISGIPIILNDLDGNWGEAIDIDSSEAILLRVHIGKDIILSREAVAWLWEGGEVTNIGKPSDNIASFYPHILTNDKRVVGLSIGKNGHRIGMVGDVNGVWIPLFEPVLNRELTAVNRKLLIAGYDLVNNYRVPWIKRESEEIEYLPHYRNHHHQITMLSEQGWAVGTATADNCCHPLLWKL